jgi:hypothetical protein
MDGFPQFHFFEGGLFRMPAVPDKSFNGRPLWKKSEFTAPALCFARKRLAA